MLNIQVARRGAVTILEVQGRVDSISAGQLETVIEQEGANHPVILDLSAVDYLSGAGVRALKRLHDLPGGIRLARPSDRVREVLQIISLDYTFDSFETLTEAIRSLTSITNAHTHLEMSWMAAALPPPAGTPFVTWMLDIIGRIQQLRAQGDLEMTYRRSAEAGIQQLIDAGTTAVGDISALGLSIEPLLESGLSGVVYVELLALDPTVGAARLRWVRDTIERWRPKERNGMHIGIELHAPYTLHPDLLKQAVDYARKEALPVCIHVAESAAERDYFVSGKGDFADRYYPGLKMPPVPVPGVSPVRYLEDLGALALKPLLAHAVQVDEDDIRRIRAAGASVAHCPRSNLRLQCGRMPLEQYLAAGVPVYLGTDGLSSSPSLNVFDELEAAAALHHDRVPAEALEKLVYRPLPA